MKFRDKKLLAAKPILGVVSSVTLALGLASTAHAAWTPIAMDTLSWTAGEMELNANGNWAGSDTEIMYTVSYDFSNGPGSSLVWKYDYNLTVSGPGDISHVDLEVSYNGEGAPETFTSANLITANGEETTSPVQGPTILDADDSQSNPDMPEDLYGLKWDVEEVTGGIETTNFVWQVISDRGPAWGDFYSKDGLAGGDINWVYNAGFTDPDGDNDTLDDSDPTLDVNDLWLAFQDQGSKLDPINNGGDTSTFNFVLDHLMVPDSEGFIPPDEVPPEEIPVPGTVALSGLGLLGMLALNRRRRKLHRQFDS